MSQSKPLLLITGFLGAGKTTLLRDLLIDLRRQDLKSDVILNDFANAELDSATLDSRSVMSVAPLAAGCACCDSLEELIMALAIFNGKSFSTEFLGLFRSSAAGNFTGLALHSDVIPGWNFRPNDVLRRFNKEGDSVDDIVIFNPRDWASKEYLGILSNDGKGSLSGNWQEGWIGGWNLGTVDHFKVVDFRGSSNWDDLFIFNKNWFGLLRGKKYSFGLEAIYHKWIQNHRYHGSNLY